MYAVESDVHSDQGLYIEGDDEGMRGWVNHLTISQCVPHLLAHQDCR